MIKQIWFTLKKLISGNRSDQELDEEIRFHLEMSIEQKMEAGMSRREAEIEARKAFGNILYKKEECRASWGVRLIDDLVNDVRYGLRQLFKNKTQTLVIILTLAICIGATTTALNYSKAIVSNPYAFKESERIVQIGKKEEKLEGDKVSRISIPLYKYVQQHSESLSSVAFINDSVSFDLNLGGKVQRILTDLVTPEVWSITGIQPIAGRFFQDDEIESSDGKLIVLGEHLWRELGGEEQNLIGQTLMLDDINVTVMGVAPAKFHLGYFRADAWIPRKFEPWETADNQRNSLPYMAIGKMKKGYTVTQVNDELSRLWKTFTERFPEDAEVNLSTGANLGAVELNHFLSRDIPQITIAFDTVKYVTLVVLVIGCLNIGGMFLVSGYSRIQEFAMRQCLGASIQRIYRQLLIEIMVYFLFGALFSLLILKAGFAATDYLGMDIIPWVDEWEINAGSLLITLEIAFIAALITGFIPLLSILRKDLIHHVKAGSRTIGGSEKHKAHSCFVISQIALSVVLLCVASILLKNLGAVGRQPVGYAREGKISFEIPQPDYRFGQSEEAYKTRVIPHQKRIVESLRTLPGVISVAATSKIPLSHKNQDYSDFTLDHYQYAKGEVRIPMLSVTTSPGYFQTVGTKLTMGRDFRESDDFNSESVAIVDQNMVDLYFKLDGQNNNTSPIGKMIRFRGHDMKIIGVAEPVQDLPFFLERRHFTLYTPFSQWVNANPESTTFVVNVRGNVDQTRQTIQNFLRENNPDLTVYAETFDEVFEFATSMHRTTLSITLFFAFVASFLTGIGIYGLTNYMVVERTKEYGIRMALGANPGMIMRAIFGRSGKLVAWGVGIGLIISILLCHKINPLLEFINTLQPLVFMTVSIFVLGIAAMACSFPVRHITRINIIDTIRND